MRQARDLSHYHPHTPLWLSRWVGWGFGATLPPNTKANLSLSPGGCLAHGDSSCHLHSCMWTETLEAQERSRASRSHLQHTISYMLHSLRSPTRVTPLLWRVMYTGHPTGVHSKTDLISDRMGFSGLPPPAYHISIVPVTLRIPTLRFQIFFLSCTDR